MTIHNITVQQDKVTEKTLKLPKIFLTGRGADVRLYDKNGNKISTDILFLVLFHESFPLKVSEAREGSWKGSLPPGYVEHTGKSFSDRLDRSAKEKF